MSTPQSASTKRTKRPRGLLASRKTTGNPAESEPAAKRARGEDTPPQDPEELKLQDWHDLEELFENALDALYGPNWTSAIPLIQTQVGPEKAPAVGVSLLINVNFIQSRTNYSTTFLLIEDEPEEALEYLLSALSACKKGEQALDVRKQTKAWDLEFTWGRVLVAAAQSLSDSKDEPRVSENAALARAFEHLTYGIDHRPRYTDSDSEAKDEQKSKDERFVRALLESAQGVLATSESLQFLHQVEEMSVPEELRVQVILVLGQINLAIGSSIAEKFEEDSNAEDGTGSEGLETRKVAIGCSEVRCSRELCSKQSTEKAESVVEELKPMLQEALVTLATLLPEGPEQERMYSRYQAEGGILDDEDDEDDEE
ncbi:hypothetical protein RHS01_03583 [Rhizoctonia solani]|uniref:Uncharacterized protein n=1 Tax=Rhizoctonia solani TaxID=456999 RepID=A0A8H7IIC6_9AGAM|nr:hypothetical protein RHS01_03583 [Rhizoctonia solani]